MSDREDDLYRGDPPAGSTAAGQRPDQDPTAGYRTAAYGTAGYGTAQGQGAPAGYGPPAGYPAPAGYDPQGGWQPQPGYGPPPGYGPAGPGYPPQSYGAPGWPRPTNTMAILALVLAFVFAPAGLVLGILARKEIRRTGEAGDGLALAGIIIGGIATALFVLLIVFWVIAFASIASSDGFAP